MFHRIFVPRDIKASHITIANILVIRGQRVYQGDVLISLSTGNSVNKIPILAPINGFISHIAVKPDQAVAIGELLLVMHVVQVGDYMPSLQECNLNTESGDTGRRGLERILLKEHGVKKFAAALFDAPQEQREPGSHSALRTHPLLQHMKEGVPMKMRAEAANNDPAIARATDDANRDPEFRKQLSPALQQQLAIQSVPKAAPTLIRQ